MSADTGCHDERLLAAAYALCLSGNRRKAGGVVSRLVKEGRLTRNLMADSSAAAGGLFWLASVAREPLVDGRTFSQGGGAGVSDDPERILFAGLCDVPKDDLADLADLHDSLATGAGVASSRGLGFDSMCLAFLDGNWRSKLRGRSDIGSFHSKRDRIAHVAWAEICAARGFPVEKENDSMSYFDERMAELGLRDGRKIFSLLSPGDDPDTRLAKAAARAFGRGEYESGVRRGAADGRLTDLCVWMSVNRAEAWGAAEKTTGWMEAVGHGVSRGTISDACAAALLAGALGRGVTRLEHVWDMATKFHCRSRNPDEKTHETLLTAMEAAGFKGESSKASMMLAAKRMRGDALARTERRMLSSAVEGTAVKPEARKKRI